MILPKELNCTHELGKPGSVGCEYPFGAMKMMSNLSVATTMHLFGLMPDVGPDIVLHSGEVIGVSFSLVTSTETPIRDNKCPEVQMSSNM